MSVSPLDRPHKGIAQLLKKEQRRREKLVENDWISDQPKFDTPLGKRRLRILNAIFWALSKRGHDGDPYEHDDEIHARAIIGNTYLGLRIEIVGKHRTVRENGYLRLGPDLPASTPLALRLDPGFDRKATVTWLDDDDGSLETKIAAIAAGIIMAEETSSGTASVKPKSILSRRRSNRKNGDWSA